MLVDLPQYHVHLLVVLVAAHVLLDADAADREKYARIPDIPSAFEALAQRNSPVGQLKEKLRPFANLLRSSR